MPNSSDSQQRSGRRMSFTPPNEDSIVYRVLEFIRQELPNWRDDPRRIHDKSEKLLNSSLCDFLDVQSRDKLPMIRFKHEAPQTETRTIDIAVQSASDPLLIGALGYSIYDPFLVFEAKRLPAPTASREREYVEGSHTQSGSPAGGIQRFKLGLHGSKVDNAGMIAYVEENTADHWYRTINIWIAACRRKNMGKSCRWGKKDELNSLLVNRQDGLAEAKSKHRRVAGCITEEILIHHFWVSMTHNQGSSQIQK